MAKLLEIQCWCVMCSWLGKIGDTDPNELNLPCCPDCGMVVDYDDADIPTQVVQVEGE